MESYDRSLLEVTKQEVDSWPLWIDDSSGLTIDQLVARAWLSIKRNKAELVIVDYLQKVHAKGDDVERISRVSAALTQLAKDGAPVIALSQFNRPDQHNINRLPNMTDLRGSGTLEQDAHVILLIHRPVDERGQFTGEDLFLIEKQRNGPTGIEPMELDLKTLRFKERVA